jgi:hypothetical protein
MPESARREAERFPRGALPLAGKVSTLEVIWLSPPEKLPKPVL